MLRSFYSGISGLRNHQQAMDIVGNNLANVNTTGYKASRTTFMDTLSQTIQGGRAGSTTSGGKNAMQVGLGMTIAAIDRDVSQGALQSTGRNLDMAIEGDGWFSVGTVANGVNSFYYTRAGNFFVDDSANLVTSGGDFVYGWIDTDDTGTIDVSRDEMGFINLDRLGDGSITNALASATLPITGPNQGDASIKKVSTLPTTITDTWRVENINAQQGWFRVSGTKTGVVGTFTYTNPIAEARIGSFNIDMGAPAKARLAVPFSSPDGNNEQLTFDATGTTSDYSINFLSGGSGAVSVSIVGDTVNVTMPVDSDGIVSATFEDIVTAMNDAFAAATPAVSISVGYGATSTANTRATALVNQVVSVPQGVATTVDVGDVGPTGVLGWTSNEYGAGGNNVNIRFVNRGAQQRTTEVQVDGSNITVYLAANSSGKVNATAAEVYTAFQNSAAASALVTMDDPSLLGYENLVVEPFTQLFFQNGAGADLGDYFTFTTTAPGGAKLESLSVNREGGIIGVFDNGSTEEIARVAVAKIPNPQGMLAVGQGKFALSPVSGEAELVVPGTKGSGGIASGFLEMSNVDLTREFTDMIVNQRGFQANSRIITTSDEMLQELMALKR